MASNDQTKAYLYAGGAVALWSTVATAFKLSLRYLTPIQLLAVASVVSTAVLFALLAVSKQLGLLRKLGRKDWLRASWLGLLNPFAYYLVLFEAYDRLPAQEAQPLNYTWAITLTLLSVPLLKHKLALRDLAGILVSYAGVVIIATRGNLGTLHFADPIGVGLALGSTVLWSLYWIANTADRKPPLVGLSLNFLFGSGYTLGAMLLLYDVELADWRGVLGGVYVGVFEMGIAFALWLQALRLTRSTARIANLIFLSPFLSLVLIHLLVGERIAMSTFVGLLFIVAGIGAQRLGRRTVEPSEGRG